MILKNVLSTLPFLLCCGETTGTFRNYCLKVVLLIILVYLGGINYALSMQSSFLLTDMYS